MMKELTAALIWGGGGVAAALGATIAYKLGYIDIDTVTRVIAGVNGLLIAWYGNRMPKAMVPRTRQATRVAGWSMVLGGLVYAGLWAFAPIPVAIIGGCVTIVAEIAVTLGYCLSQRAKAKAA
ncbi:MAG: Ammonium transporter [Sphingomonas bacterium]|uniref:ammonium transporter n=1 Tax=Sphingomonas bacterium TaxID=1895847 RepID=UPI0026133D3A|nr:ammonium transporter [Sphingomonas bacterium]MDB5705577.1 Ammonium transporter [Sphingomonas bacterium]